MDDPQSSEPAPGTLALVEDFVNTARNCPVNYDRLVDIPAAAVWLSSQGFEVSPDEAQRRKIVETREHLRTLLGVNSGQTLPRNTRRSSAASSTRGGCPSTGRR